ncbi:MAG: LysR family transcriptional regulator [Oceanospirillum sp.]|nr:LysR family transcriptional regulator [Oceanospirillum sp.]
MAIVSRTKDLEILLTVVDCGGFSAAARQLDIQVARVSRAVSRLENELNVTLMNRTTRRFQLTEEGELFINRVREGLQHLTAAEESLKQTQEKPVGRLRVDAASPFILHQLVPLVAGFNATFPDIQLELLANETIIDLIERRTDIAIRIGDLEDSNLHARLLGRTPLHIVASQEYLANKGTPRSAEELKQHQIIGFSDSPHLNLWPLHGSQNPGQQTATQITPASSAKDLKATIKVTPSLSSSNGEVVRQLCLQGQGMALLSHFMVAEDIRQGRLISVLHDQLISPNRREAVQAVYYKNSVVATRISAFLDYIQPRLNL